MSRIECKLTDEQLEKLKNASKPVTYMVFGGIEPSSPAENANRAWREVAKEHGVKWDTIAPIAGKGQHYFSAEKLEEL